MAAPGDVEGRCGRVDGVALLGELNGRQGYDQEVLVGAGPGDHPGQPVSQIRLPTVLFPGAARWPRIADPFLGQQHRGKPLEVRWCEVVRLIKVDQVVRVRAFDPELAQQTVRRVGTGRRQWPRGDDYARPRPSRQPGQELRDCGPVRSGGGLIQRIDNNHQLSVSHRQRETVTDVPRQPGSIPLQQRCRRIVALRRSRSANAARNSSAVAARA